MGHFLWRKLASKINPNFDAFIAPYLDGFNAAKGARQNMGCLENKNLRVGYSRSRDSLAGLILFSRSGLLFGSANG